VKCLLQIQNNDKLLYNGMIDCVRKIYKENGIRGVYKGFLITMYRELPASGVYFSTYEYVKKTLRKNNDEYNFI
jgi:solute carrier family 25 carnitine/acylcarnitine transporter 20/29